MTEGVLMRRSKKTGRMKPCAHCATPFYCVPCRDVGGTCDEKKYCSPACNRTARAPNRERSLAAFWAKVNKTDDCWLWTGYRNWAGYGLIHNGAINKRVITHRFSWEIANGPIPEGLNVLHRCDVPACVNPGHLFLGTVKENMVDKARKGRDPVSQLTADQVRDIRGLFGKMKQKDIAARFNVNHGVISKLKKRKTYLWVP